MTSTRKTQLLQSIQTGYKLFKELLAEFDDDPMIEPGVVGEWSVKDTVAHIIVHEQGMLQWMTKTLSGEQPCTPQPYNMPDDELDQLNKLIYQENKNRLLDDVMHDLDTAHAAALRLVGAASEEDIFDPSGFHLREGEPLWEAIAANTFWHYEEHGQDIRTWKVTLYGVQSLGL